MDIFKIFLKLRKVSTDTRVDISDSIFFALKGENFNGNKYALDALKKGAQFVVVDEEIEGLDDRIIKVKDSLTALQKLATEYRKYLEIPVIAITGSNGKTTTKELISTVLNKKFKCHFTQGNFNNHLGLPLTILSAPQDTELLLLEMGASAIGEIKLLSQIAQPNYGIITNIGEAHLEGFGSLEGVMQGKSELYDYLKLAGGLAFVNSNEPHLLELSEKVNRILYGDCDKLNKLQYCGQNVSFTPDINFELVSKRDNIKISSTLSGEYNYQNVLTAAVIGCYFNVSHEIIAEAIKEYIPKNNRSQILKIGNALYYMDAYNANPSSMLNSVGNFLNLNHSSKSIILGSMKELGEYEQAAHKKLMDFIEFNLEAFRIVIFVGSEYKNHIHHEKVHYFKSVDDLKKEFSLNSFTGDAVLLKGSRSNKLEDFIDIDNKQ